jgi:Na+-driven multidrug efflux pump
VAQNIGVHNIKRAGRSVSRAMLITVAFGATFGALSALFSAQLSSLMSPNPEVIRFSQQKMIIISSTYFICGINEVLCAALRGMGRPLVPTFTALVFTCILRFVWVYLVFPLIPNMTFLYLVWPIGWIASIICALVVYFPTKRKLTAAHQPLSE